MNEKETSESETLNPSTEQSGEEAAAVAEASALKDVPGEQLAEWQLTFNRYINEVRQNNPHFGPNEYLAERERFYNRTVPGDVLLAPFDFEFPFDIQNPPRVEDVNADQDE